MVKKRRKRKSRYNRGTYDSIKGGSCKYRSGWELSYIKYLDDSEDVTSFQYEHIKIPYVSNTKTKKIRTYIPDFFVTYSNGKQSIIEVKPKRKLTQAIIKKKHSAATSYCEQYKFDFIVITEVELKALGLL